MLECCNIPENKKPEYKLTGYLNIENKKTEFKTIRMLKFQKILKQKINATECKMIRIKT